MTPEENRYRKLTIELRSRLKGKGYHKALEAMEFARERTLGFRKDGVTPKFQHQIEICLFILTLKEVQFEEDTLAAAFLHDVREDPFLNEQNKETYVEDSEIRNQFGDRVADAVERLTKEFKGVKKDINEYFSDIAKCPIASIVKLSDRIHNISSMVGVFSLQKQEAYVIETQTYFLPLLKVVRKRFPQQYDSYHAMGTFIKNMCKTIEAVIVAQKELLNLEDMYKKSISKQSP